MSSQMGSEEPMKNKMKTANLYMSQTVKQTNRYYAWVGWSGCEAWRVIESFTGSLVTNNRSDYFLFLFLSRL